MEEVERRYIARVLEAVSGSRNRAAQVLGFDRKTLYRKIKRFGLELRPPPALPSTSPTAVLPSSSAPSSPSTTPPQPPPSPTPER
jgi:hypothetical protein